MRKTNIDYTGQNWGKTFYIYDNSSFLNFSLKIKFFEGSALNEVLGLDRCVLMEVILYIEEEEIRVQMILFVTESKSAQICNPISYHVKR